MGRLQSSSRTLGMGLVKSKSSSMGVSSLLNGGRFFLSPSAVGAAGAASSTATTVGSSAMVTIGATRKSDRELHDFSTLGL